MLPAGYKFFLTNASGRVVFGLRARGDDMDKKQGEALSSAAFTMLVVADAALPLLKPSKRQKVRVLRTLETLALTKIVTVVLKRSVDEKRPDSEEQNSFPSSHTLNAMGVATVSSAFSPKQSPVWYGGVLLIGASHLLLRRHRTRDVLAGVGLGYILARLELSRRRGILLPGLSKRLSDAWSQRK